MKEKILQLLKEFSVTENSSSLNRIIEDIEFDQLSDKILNLFKTNSEELIEENNSLKESLENLAKISGEI